MEFKVEDMVRFVSCEKRPKYAPAPVAMGHTDKAMNIKNLKHYVKRPVQVAAMQLNVDNFGAALQWCGGCCHTTDLPGGDKAIDGLVIHTLEGDHVAKIGDYIIRGVKGEFYPCKPNIFNETYEEVQNDD